MRSVISHSYQDAVLLKLRAILGSLPGFREALCCSFDEIQTNGHATDPELVIVSLAGDPRRALEVIQDLRGMFQGYFLAVGPVADPKMILHTLQMGADHYLDQADLEADFKAALSRLRLKTNPQGARGRLLGVLSASGGCGASTLAVNLGAILAKEHGKCNLIDLNPGRGDLASLLDLKPHYTLADACKNECRLDSAMLDKMLVRHACGIHLLASSSDFSQVCAVSPRGVMQAVSLAGEMFPEVIVDLEDCFHEEQVEVLRLATGTFLVCSLDFTSLRNARRVLDYLAKLTVQRQRIKVVINRHGQPNELPVAQAEDVLGEKVSCFIPFDPKTINAANNTGIPAVVREPQSKVSLSIAKFAKIDFEKRPGSSALLLKT